MIRDASPRHFPGTGAGFPRGLIFVRYPLRGRCPCGGICHKYQPFENPVILASHKIFEAGRAERNVNKRA